jgi:hypothetical protein
MIQLLCVGIKNARAETGVPAERRNEKGPAIAGRASIFIPSEAISRASCR